jgi:hypothetical protein
MRNRLFLAATVLLACAFPLRGQSSFYQIELVPSGKMIAKQAPVWRGTTLVFKKYPDGTLMSIRKSDVKKITQITEAAEQANTTQPIIQIGNLAMQGGSSQAGAANARTVKPAAKTNSSGLGTGFYSDVVPGETQAYGNSPNDYQVGKTYAYAPASASQSSAGAPPTAPADTNGANPPH